jgi:hypothetical protein
MGRLSGWCLQLRVRDFNFDAGVLNYSRQREERPDCATAGVDRGGFAEAD